MIATGRSYRSYRLTPTTYTRKRRYYTTLLVLHRSYYCNTEIDRCQVYVHD